MTYIQPLSSFYLVTHSDLIKYGIDMAQRAKQVTSSVTNENSISKSLFSFQLPQIISATEPKQIITIRKKVKKKYEEIKVDRNTGIIIHPNDAFSYISKFDQKSFPKAANVVISKVAYWDLANNYKESKTN